MRDVTLAIGGLIGSLWVLVVILFAIVVLLCLLRAVIVAFHDLPQVIEKRRLDRAFDAVMEHQEFYDALRRTTEGR